MLWLRMTRKIKNRPRTNDAPRLAFSCVIGLALGIGQTGFSDQTLSVGSDAPSIDVEHWVRDGAGKFPKVTKFEAGKTYVVEFWGTFCGPCIESMPHLVSLQKKHAAQGLQIISISTEPLETVIDFLGTKINDDQGKETTVGELTNAYCLTTDPDESVYKDYMVAAEQDGIPCAFVVGKDSKVEWIGHPMEMDRVLNAVLDGSWNREQFLAEKKLMEEIQTTIGGLFRKKQYSEAIVAIDGFINRVSDKRLQFSLRKNKIDFQIMDKVDEKEIIASYESLFESCKSEPLFLQDIAWTAFEKFTEGKLATKDVISLSIPRLENVLESVVGGDRANLYDTIARLQHALGQLDKSIQAQTQAVQLSDGSDAGGFKEFLDELESEAKALKK
jgi:thiol-disulfide isomerase/thioredoxin